MKTPPIVLLLLSSAALAVPPGNAGVAQTFSLSLRGAAPAEPAAPAK